MDSRLVSQRDARAERDIGVGEAWQRAGPGAASLRSTQTGALENVIPHTLFPEA